MHAVLKWNALTVVLSSVLALSTARAQGPGLDKAYADAQQSLQNGNLAGAQVKFEALSRAHPEIAEIHATLGALLFQRGDFSAALKELEQAKRLKPTLPKLDGLIAMTQAELGHHADAAGPLEEAFRTAEDPPVKRMNGLELERVYTATGQDAKAVEVALQLQRLYPNDPEVLYHNERIFGNYAFLTVQSLVKVAPESVWRYQAQAEAEESQGSHDAAIATYRKALALDPIRPGLHYRMGRALRERYRDNHHPEDLQLAMTEFEAELKLDPHNASAQYEIGELHRLAGRLPEAKVFFEAALGNYPDFAEANLGLGTVLVSLKQPVAALAYVKKAVAVDPTDEASWYRLSQIERDLGHKQEQTAALEKFRELHRAADVSPRPPEHEVSRQTVDTEPE